MSPPAMPISQTLFLDQHLLARFLWGAAALTALSHHTNAVKTSPSALLKAAEWYHQAWSLCIPVAVYRQLKYGTQDSGSFDMLEARTEVAGLQSTRSSLYRDMCNNTFMYMARGPGALQQYLDHIVMRTEGHRTSLDQFFSAVHQQNDAVREGIDRFRRRTYAVKVSAEAAMVLLGAGPISLGLQIGVGLGYALITTAITSYSEMSKADIVAMPAKRPQPGPETLGDAAASNAASTGMNLLQEGGDHAAELLTTFELTRQRALASQAGRIEAKIAEVVAKSGAGRDHISKAALNTVKDLTLQGEAVAARRATPILASGAATQSLKYGTRAAGIAVGIYFLREDIANVISFVREGDL